LYGDLSAPAGLAMWISAGLAATVWRTSPVTDPVSVASG
jgi:hypothetical protein